MIKIRKAKLSDAKQIAELEKTCFPEAEACDLKTFKERLTIFNDHFLVIDMDGCIIGVINGMVTNQNRITDDLYANAFLHNEEGNYQSIFGLLVHPKYQHRGYATKLMYAMIDHAIDNKRAGLILTCKEEKISFYEQFGYCKLGLSQSTHGNATWYDMMLKL